MTPTFFRPLARWPTYVAAGPMLFFSGQCGFQRGRYRLCGCSEDVAGTGPGAPSAYDWVNRMEAPVGAQAAAIYERYGKLLGKERGGLGSFVRYHIYQRDKRFFPVFDRVRRHYETAPPASTAVGMGRFDPDDAARLCIDSIAYRAPERGAGGRAVLGGSVKHAAAAHFSHVIGAGPYLFVAGQIPIDTSLPGFPLIRNYDDVPEKGRFLRVGRSHEDTRNGPIAAQTWFTYDLIRKHLEAAGSALNEVLNLIVYLQDMRDFPTFHRVHERFFPKDPPALTVVEVGEVGHKGTLIEIEPTAIISGKGVTRRIVAPMRGMPAQMSALVEAGGLAFLSGFVPVRPDGAPVTARKDLPSGALRRAGNTRSPVVLQVASILHQLEEVMRAAGHGLDRVVHLTVYLDRIAEFAGAVRLLEQVFGARRPALTLLEVPRPAPLAGVKVQCTAIAWLGEGAPRRVRVAP